MSHRQVRSVLSADLLRVACCFLGCMTSAMAVEPFDPPMREQWSRGDVRVLREWLLLGPLPGTLQADELAGRGGEAAVHPAAGDVGGPVRWISQPWGQDLLELSAVFSSRQEEGV